ncbi:MAG: FecR domain-containing protein, partial [Odoribacter sp.]|nr:FecR domain-containing protein [Odoribacter sp.]
MESQIQEAYRIADLILRHRENALSPAESEELERWIAASPEHGRQWEELNDREFLLRKHRQESTIDTSAAYVAFSKRIAAERPRKGVRRLYVWSAVAAVCVILVGVNWFWSKETVIPVPVAENTVIPAGGHEAVLTLANGEQFCLQGATTSIRQDDGSVADVSATSIAYKADSSSHEALLYNSLYVPRKGEFALTLSDGTRIWLNSETTVEYPTRFLPGQRKVRLRGEAYFQVARNTASPFVIETGEAQIRVLGTSFNLRAYEDEQVIQTTLEEGSVSLSAGKQQMTLMPNEQGCIDMKTGDMSKKVVDVRVYAGWKDGRFVFERQTLGEIMRTLARWYDVEAVFQSERTRN